MTVNSKPAFNDELSGADPSERNRWQASYQWSTPDRESQDSDTAYSHHNNPDYAPLVSVNPISTSNGLTSSGVLDIADRWMLNSINPTGLKDMPCIPKAPYAAGASGQLHGCFDSNGVGATLWLRPQDGSWLPETHAMADPGECPSTVYQTIQTGITAANGTFLQAAMAMPGH